MLTNAEPMRNFTRFSCIGKGLAKHGSDLVSMMVLATPLLRKLIDVLSSFGAATLSDSLSDKLLIMAFVFRILSIPRNSGSQRPLSPNCFSKRLTCIGFPLRFSNCP